MRLQAANSQTEAKKKKSQDICQWPQLSSQPFHMDYRNPCVIQVQGWYRPACVELENPPGQSRRRRVRTELLGKMGSERARGKPGLKKKKSLGFSWETSLPKH